MSANEKGWVFTGGDYAIGVHGDRFVESRRDPHARPPLSGPEGDPVRRPSRRSSDARAHHGCIPRGLTLRLWRVSSDTQADAFLNGPDSTGRIRPWGD